MRDTLLSAAVFIAILMASAVVTNWFAKTMYLRCTACATLNAKRRMVCRSCGKMLRER